MTYDPFSYGQVSLGGGKKAPAASPDDILFADAAPPAKGKAPKGADSSWELLDADVTSLLPNAPPPAADVAEFGAEILGEAVEPAPARPAPRAPAPAPTARRTVGGPAADKVAEPAAAPRKIEPVRQKPAAPPPRPVRLSATVVPAGLFAAGGTGAAWLYAMQQDLVMAAIVGALSVVGAAFAWVWLRG